jgi:hypothetical protein
MSENINHLAAASTTLLDSLYLCTQARVQAKVEYVFVVMKGRYM